MTLHDKRTPDPASANRPSPAERYDQGARTIAALAETERMALQYRSLLAGRLAELNATEADYRRRIDALPEQAELDRIDARLGELREVVDDLSIIRSVAAEVMLDAAISRQLVTTLAERVEALELAERQRNEVERRRRQRGRGAFERPARVTDQADQADQDGAA